MTKEDLWGISLSAYKKQNQVWDHGYLVGLLEGEFGVLSDFDSEWFVDFLIDKELNPFEVGIDKCKEEYYIYLSEQS